MNASDLHAVNNTPDVPLKERIDYDSLPPLPKEPPFSKSLWLIVSGLAVVFWSLALYGAWSIYIAITLSN